MYSRADLLFHVLKLYQESINQNYFTWSATMDIHTPTHLTRLK